MAASVLTSALLHRFTQVNATGQRRHMYACRTRAPTEGGSGPAALVFDTKHGTNGPLERALGCAAWGSALAAVPEAARSLIKCGCVAVRDAAGHARLLVADPARLQACGFRAKAVRKGAPAAFVPLLDRCGTWDAPHGLALQTAWASALAAGCAAPDGGAAARLAEYDALLTDASTRAATRRALLSDVEVEALAAVDGWRTERLKAKTQTQTTAVPFWTAVASCGLTLERTGAGKPVAAPKALEKLQLLLPWVLAPCAVVLEARARALDTDAPATAMEQDAVPATTMEQDAAPATATQQDALRRAKAVAALAGGDVDILAALSPPWSLEASPALPPWPVEDTSAFAAAVEAFRATIRAAEEAAAASVWKLIVQPSDGTSQAPKALPAVVLTESHKGVALALAEKLELLDERLGVPRPAADSFHDRVRALLAAVPTVPTYGRTTPYDYAGEHLPLHVLRCLSLLPMAEKQLDAPFGARVYRDLCCARDALAAMINFIKAPPLLHIPGTLYRVIEAFEYVRPLAVTAKVVAAHCEQQEQELALQRSRTAADARARWLWTRVHHALCTARRTRDAARGDDSDDAAELETRDTAADGANATFAKFDAELKEAEGYWSRKRKPVPESSSDFDEMLQRYRRHADRVEPPRPSRAERKRAQRDAAWEIMTAPVSMFQQYDAPSSRWLATAAQKADVVGRVSRELEEQQAAAVAAAAKRSADTREAWIEARVAYLLEHNETLTATHDRKRFQELQGQIQRIRAELAEAGMEGDDHHHIREYQDEVDSIRARFAVAAREQAEKDKAKLKKDADARGLVMPRAKEGGMVAFVRQVARHLRVPQSDFLQRAEKAGWTEHRTAEKRRREEGEDARPSKRAAVPASSASNSVQVVASAADKGSTAACGADVGTASGVVAGDAACLVHRTAAATEARVEGGTGATKDGVAVACVHTYP